MSQEVQATIVTKKVDDAIWSEESIDLAPGF